ncbi:MAG: flagellar export chaperone FliS [Fimbriimonadaceae bacterium]
MLESGRGQTIVAYTNPYLQQYRRTSVESATPLQLIVMLYDGALRFIEQGKGAMARGAVEEQNAALQKAQKIVAELMSSLDMDKGAEVAKNLLSLYTFTYNRLIEGNCEDDVQKIDQAAEVMRQLRESWAKLEEQSRQNRPTLTVEEGGLSEEGFSDAA